ncbi:NAD(P)/FAD-dependent oxidoreductase [Dorea formicigenerans]|uniref:NAD(P)/FAD-dependent oxidoreductase n=1 Tax=Dorea formicigenerans TaxID=39486 RepID=A0A3E4F3D1_9FIRM|nr:NAD(P)/FAD-dependent oxidoreductase [Dorea formicigenerans]RGI83443.1 NAD(P)/FAD-dependent oxidoreductase [Dorea formicigenerans]RGI85165.1 NAD(P)/FAD-dependent oxidoreductase [Dorea formicigenerans]RGO54767.1 NAD(P)/FAD-dependent oxidoreductase [Dorea formicigenerans]RGR61110.1 NAD(P)/FAD-dependent oxidoreductase [Dorea formicigenerans]RGW55694.1 NAD(P)/FAD-dependent oxidoreductase [Dorea formicigenerans]
MSHVIVVGGGAAGMFAAIAAAKNGHQVTLYEKNEKLGKKIFITGKGRCNITNAADMEELFDAVVTNSKFLYSSFYGYTNQNVIDFFEDAGVPVKIERGNRVFPISDHSSDVIRALEREMKKVGVKVCLNTEVKSVEAEKDKFNKVVLKDTTTQTADACIVATGGLSYRSTGSTGDGFRFAENVGHKVTQCFPSLVPMETKEPWICELQGLSLRNVEAKILDGKKELYKDFGEMLFTHFGVSGPLIISASSYVGKKFMDKNGQKKELTLEIDLKPALTEEQLDQRVLRDFEENHNRQFKNAITKLFPTKLIPVMLELGGIDPEKKVNSIEKEERKQFVHLIKHFRMTLTGLRDYPEAIITKGGVNVKEIDPGTMESKLVKGLYFAGEVLDLDALTGGFNLQIAWSTGYAAGNAIQ